MQDQLATKVWIRFLTPSVESSIQIGIIITNKYDCTAILIGLILEAAQSFVINPTVNYKVSKERQICLWISNPESFWQMPKLLWHSNLAWPSNCNFFSSDTTWNLIYMIWTDYVGIRSLNILLSINNMG